MNKEEEIKKLKEALSIAADWNVNQVQVNPPKEWNLSGGEEDAEEGWCSTLALANKLRQLSQE